MVYTIQLTTNMLGVRVFFAMIVANFDVFLWAFSIKQLFTRACWICGSYSQFDATRLFGYPPSHIQRALVEK